MALDKKVRDHLKKLKHYKGKKGWKNFFKAFETLDELSDQINHKMHFEESTKNLDARAKNLIRRLNNTKDAVSKRTKTDIEYDAVFDSISELKDSFR